MKISRITAHCLIRNEERWIWYALGSIIDYVDQILIFDTGSTDHTVDIIKTIKSPKIVFEQKGIVDKIQFTKLRQEMIYRTQTPWFMVLDGDEIWPEAAITQLIKAIRIAPKHVDAIVVPQWICQGDLFHYSREIENLREERLGKRGFWLPRAWRMIPGLHAIGKYGIESYADKKGVNVSYWSLNRLQYTTQKFFHMTFLPRSASVAKDRDVMMRSEKTLFYKGVSFPTSMKYPEVFYISRPNIVPPPWRKMTVFYQLKGFYYRTLNFIDRITKITWNPISYY